MIASIVVLSLLLPSAFPNAEQESKMPSVFCLPRLSNVQELFIKSHTYFADVEKLATYFAWR